LHDFLQWASFNAEAVGTVLFFTRALCAQCGKSCSGLSCVHRTCKTQSVDLPVPHSYKSPSEKVQIEP